MMNRILLPLIAMMMIVGTASAERVRITGKVLDERGRPMPNANVMLTRPNQANPLFSVDADDQGNYSLATDEHGLAILQFAGPGHQTHSVGLLLDDSITTTIYVRLQPHAYRTTIDTLYAIGDFNGFDYASAIPLVPLPDGCFELELPAGTAPVSYQILGLVDVGAVDAPASSGYMFDGKGGYKSVASPKNGRLKITLDPMQLVRGRWSARVACTDVRIAAMVRIYSDIARRRDAYQQALVENRMAGRTLSEFSYDWSKDLNQLFKQLAQEKDSVLRGMLVISYLELGTLGATKELRPAVAKWAFETIPPTSSIWSINPRLIMLAAERSGKADSTHQQYIAEVIDKHEDPYVRSMLLYDGLTTAYTAKQEDKAQAYYTRLTTEFSSSRFAAMARAQFSFGY